MRSISTIQSKFESTDGDHSVAIKIESPEDDNMQTMSKIDVSLMLKLQQKLKEVETEKARLEKKVEALEAQDEDSPRDETKRTQDLIRVCGCYFKAF